MFSNLLVGSVIALSVGKTLAAGAVTWGGVNIAGFDFSCDTSGACNPANVDPPLRQYGGADGAAQMQHFVQNDKLNMFRLPVAWQYLTNNVCGGPLDAANLVKYDALVQACLVTGAHCIIDIHNYARWNGQIIGQGGPSNDDFASVWSQLGKKYASESKVVMGLMNEPHDMLDMTMWAATVQAAVTAIRKAGATSQYILLPGTGYTNPMDYVTKSGPVLEKVINLDGSTTNLIFEIHKYFDSDSSGTHPNCVSNGIDDAFAPFADYLRKVGRTALLTETGGGSNDQSCLTNVCAALDFMNKNSDVYLGYIGWAAGGFDATSYVLSLTPNPSNGLTDQPLMTQCFAAKFGGGNGASAPAPTSSPGHNDTSSVSTVVPTLSPPAAYSVSSSSSASAVSSQSAGPYSNYTTGKPFPTTFAFLVKPSSTEGATIATAATSTSSEEAGANETGESQKEEDGECDA